MEKPENQGGKGAMRVSEDGRCKVIASRQLVRRRGEAAAEWKELQEEASGAERVHIR